MLVSIEYESSLDEDAEHPQVLIFSPNHIGTSFPVLSAQPLSPTCK